MPHRRALLLMVFMTVASCGGGTQSTGSGTGGASTGTTGGGAFGGGGGAAGGGASSSSTGGGGGAADSGVTGVLQDEAGLPLNKAPVLCCSTTICYLDESNAEGRFTFELTASDIQKDFVLKSVEDATMTPRRGVTMFPLRFTGASFIDVGALLVPSMPVGAVLGPESSDPQTLIVGDGLELTVSRADLIEPLSVSLYDLAARQIPAEHVPRLAELGSEEVVAVYALYPFGTMSTSPIGIRAPSDLAAGTQVYFRTINELDGHLSEPESGQADGAWVTTGSTNGIDELTWLVISR